MALWTLKKKATDLKSAEAGADDFAVEIDWGLEFARFAETFGWLPKQVGSLTLPQFLACRTYLHLQLLASQIDKKIIKIVDDTEAFERAVLRAKQRTGKNQVTLEEVLRN